MLGQGAGAVNGVAMGFAAPTAAVGNARLAVNAARGLELLDTGVGLANVRNRLPPGSLMSRFTLQTGARQRHHYRLPRTQTRACTAPAPMCWVSPWGEVLD